MCEVVDEFEVAELFELEEDYVERIVRLMQENMDKRIWKSRMFDLSMGKVGANPLDESEIPC